MLALACDFRIMAAGRAKLSLNEITFGSSVFAGSVAMLKFLVGGKNAQSVLYKGKMYSAEEAASIGLVDEVSSAENLLSDARRAATRIASENAAAFGSIKSLLRAPVAAEMTANERRSIEEFVSLWYSDATWKNLQQIKIHA